MTPSKQRVETEPDDPKLKELVAKAGFLRVDEYAMRQFREQGKTPQVAGNPSMIKGELPSNLVKPNSTNQSPMSDRPQGAMGTIADVSSHFFLLIWCVSLFNRKNKTVSGAKL